MKSLLKYIGIIVVLRFVIAGLLLLIPPHSFLVSGLDIDPLSTAIRIVIIGWLLKKIWVNKSVSLGKSMLAVLIVFVFAWDWHWNAQTQCYPKATADGDNMSSIALDFVPFLGDFKGLEEFSSGCDYITGEKLGSFRWFGLFGIIGLAEIGVVGDVAKFGASGVEAVLKSVDDVVFAGFRASDDMLDGVMRGGRELGEAVAKNADEIVVGGGRAFNNLDGGSEPGVLRALGKECSFTGDTLVWKEEGLQPIAEIEVGDLVLAFHEEFGITNYYTVTATFTGTDERLILLTIDDERIVTTSEHPFYVQPGQWKAAADLQLDDTLIGIDRLGVVEGILRLPIVSQMYNLEVAEAHTYFVGADGWLVHNNCLISPAGLIYEKGRETFGLDHVLNHLSPVPNRKNHTVFNVRGQEELVELLDEAWVKSPNYMVEKSLSTDVRLVPMNRVIGTNGETRIRMVIKDGNELITAYPVE